MQNFMIVALLTYKGLFVSWQGREYIYTVVLHPVAYVMIIGLFGKFANDPQAAESYMIGMAIYTVPFIISLGTIESFFFDRNYGTLPYLLASSASRLLIYFNRAALHWLNGLVVFAMSLLCAWLLLGLDLSRVNWLPALGAVLAIVFSSAMFALLIGSCGVVSTNSIHFGQFAYSVVLLLTGVVIPTTDLPGVLGQIGQFVPVTHGFQAFRQAFDGADFATVTTDVLLELAIGLAYALAGYLFFGLAETLAKRAGNLQDAE